MVTARQALGQRGEELAVRYLEQQGYRIVQRNYRCPVGEMDVVAQDGDCIAFVEVRTRRSRSYGTPEESITPAKQRKLIEVASTYLQEKEIKEGDWRIDVIAIELTYGGRLARLNLIKSAVSEQAS